LTTKKIRVCELFTSIQGEGLSVGTPSFFIRTGRCSVGCKLCDTKYSWSCGRDYKAEELVKIAASAPFKNVVITGGEPLEEEALPELLKGLTESKEIEKITLETCGHIFREDIPLSEKLQIVLSPKPPTMGLRFPKRELFSFLKIYEGFITFKFILYSKEDLEEIEGFLRENSELIPRPVVFQPLFIGSESYEKSCQRVIRMVFEREELIRDFDVRIIPQVHRLVGVK